ncbi:MAG: dTDP-4-dehydrorhamnose reductase [Candidatus Helarchaeota archaeon]
MKIIIIGSKGQLGTALLETLPAEYELIGMDILEDEQTKKIDIVNAPQVSSIFKTLKPDVVINTAAFHVTDRCEKDPDTSFKVNALGARNVAVACQEINAKVVFISTDYVFDGKKTTPYSEYDRPNPLSVYGKSKIAGENYVKTTCLKYFIVRTAGIFGGEKNNFVKTMIRLGKERSSLNVVYDQIHSPTYSFDLARKIGELIETSLYGTYHISNNGVTSWYDYARKIFELTGLDKKVTVSKITAKDYGAPAPRPAYSVLRNYNLELQGMDDLPLWEDALKRYIEKEFM